MNQPLTLPLQGNSNSSRRQICSTTSLPTTSQANIEELTRDAFDKTCTYLKSQLEGTLDEFKLIQNMNQITAQKYTDMGPIANDLIHSLEALSLKQENIQPHIEQIDEIVTGIKKLESAVCSLDSYVRCLENKIKQLEKR